MKAHLSCKLTRCEMAPAGFGTVPIGSDEIIKDKQTTPVREPKFEAQREAANTKQFSFSSKSDTLRHGLRS